MFPVSLCIIVKNEVQHLDKLLEVATPLLAQIVIVDTGSTDGTVEMVQRWKKTSLNVELHYFKWIDDFAAARNFSFYLAKQDYILWLDADDFVEASALENFLLHVQSKPTVECWTLDYIYSTLPDGSPWSTLTRERLIKRSCNPKWLGAIHECIPLNFQQVEHYSSLKVVHKRTTIKDAGRNLRILESEFAKNRNDPRTAYYYGKELFDSVNRKCIEILEHYLTLPGRFYDDEVNARFRLGMTYNADGRYAEALDHAYRIYHVDHPRQRAECYFIFGVVEKSLSNWKPAIEWFERCLRCEILGGRVINTEYYTWGPHQQLEEIYKKTRCTDKANYHRDEMLKIINPVAKVVPLVTVATKQEPKSKNLKNFRLTSNMALSFAIGNIDFGPDRLRIESLKKSFMMQGFRIVEEYEADVHFARRLYSKKEGVINILDICELLGVDYYRAQGMDLADVIIAASPLLADSLRECTDKPVLVVNDCYEWSTSSTI